MKPSIFDVMRRMQRFPLNVQAAHLRSLILLEPPRSIRRHELVAALNQIVMRDLKAGNRGIRRAS